ncbi:phage tail assembly chaperone [Lysinibacillus sphaericus]|uniref:Alcohol dehydrogenase n=1 Tax=Lysinibacillus sphaericus OT4b.31 TaxID=1285586 RepID=R7Z908_LYSSH|nr:alcohol dehydrogenase [Lysinibacillus sphaericus]EON70456.1 alcohol dehydrogenase [Lysinibacillus sphaericus OT4b.31]
MGKIVTVEDLIKNKVKIEKSSDKEINSTLTVPSVGGKIKLAFTRNDIHDFHDATKNIDKNLPREQVEELLAEMGYNLAYTVISEPNLKDKELQEAYECKAPFEIVKKIFNEAEIGDIIDFAIDKAGFRNGKVVEVEDLKN